MSRKFTQARKAAFLRALGETGNQTLAAERAKVSRSWVQLHRAEDPAFRRATEWAVDEARERLLADPARRPPGGPAYAGGAELVVRGTGGSGGGASGPGRGRRVQVARARVKQWSPRVEERFLSALAATCNVTGACAEVGLTPASAYNHRGRWPAFARRWDEALEVGHDLLECALIQAAGNFLSGGGPVVPSEAGPAGMVREITADHAIHLLHMHKHRVLGLGKRPGRTAREPDMEHIRAEILRKLGVLERAGEIGRVVAAGAGVVSRRGA